MNYKLTAIAGSTTHRFTLEKTIEIARIYAMNGRSISKAFAVCAHKWPSFDTFEKVEDVVFLVEMIEDIDRLAHGQMLMGPLSFENNDRWILEILRGVAFP